MTYKEYLKELDSIIVSIIHEYVKLGGLLWRAKKEILGEEVDQLHEHLERVGILSKDRQAAVAAFLFENPKLEKGKRVRRINPKLVFQGAANSKMLSMEINDQQRLLSEEKFDIPSAVSGGVEKLTWTEMTGGQRSSLITRGGVIKTLGEQIAATNPGKLSYVKIDSVEIDRSKKIRISAGRAEITDLVSNFVKFISDKDWEILNEARKQQAQKTGVAA